MHNRAKLFVPSHLTVSFFLRNIRQSRPVEGAVRRCHAAEPGAVTSLLGLHTPGCSWRTGRSGGGPQGKLPGRREARLYGPDERTSVIPRPDQGARAPSPVRKNGPVLAKHRGGAPVGVRPTSLGAHASPGVLVTRMR